MSAGYTKLFGSILDSTVWLEDLHVKVVWVTMLAMSDRDGVVEGSIPGLAKRAGVTIGQCEESLAKFLSPDKYSRSKEHEGRRIEEVDGGWRLLNRDKYREKLDAEDQREKAAERQRRKRDRHAMSRDVTPGHAESRDVRQTEAEEDPECADPALPGPELPDPRTSDRAQIGASSDPAPVALPESDLTAQLKRSSEHIRDVGEATKLVWAELQQLRQDVATEFGLTDVWPLVIDDPGQRDLARRLRDAPGVEMGLKQARHVLVCAALEARAEGSVKWLTGAVFSDGSWRRKLGMRVEDVKREVEKKRAGPRGTTALEQQTDEPDRYAGKTWK